MKKSVVIKGLVVGALGFYCVYGTVGFAQENNSIEDIPEQKLKRTESTEPTALTVIAEKKEVDEGQTQQLTAVFTPENSTATVTWTSSDEAVATVSETGVVTALKAGTVTITAKTENGLSGEVVLTIKAKVEEIAYELLVNDFILSEDTAVTGKTDYFQTHVALVINGKEIQRKLLTSNRQFTFDVDGLIKQESDKVEIVGYRYSTEVTRQKVNIKPAKAEMTLDIYKLDTPYVTRKVTGKSAKSVRLYVNRRRQETVKIAEDGTFNLLGVGILSVTDKVEVAVLNEQGVEMLRSPVSISQ